MRKIVVDCDACGKRGEGGFEYFVIERRIIGSHFEGDRITGESCLCKECYEKLAKGDLYLHG